MPTSKTDSSVKIYDAAQGKAAFTKLLPRLSALSSTNLAAVTTDIEAASIAALGVAERVNKAPLHARFKAPAKGGASGGG